MSPLSLFLILYSHYTLHYLRYFQLHACFHFEGTMQQSASYKEAFTKAAEKTAVMKALYT